MPGERSRHRLGGERAQYETNRKRILSSQEICGICGRPVDKSIKYPHPMSPTVDHIIPVSRGGSSDISNLQLAHRCCNRQKSDKLAESETADVSAPRLVSNRDLPQTFDWKTM